jgi:predicted nuclease with TOPRIM domain
MSETLVTLAHEIEDLTERNSRLSANFDNYKLSYDVTRAENTRLRAENDKLSVRVLELERKYVRVTAALTSAGHSILAAKEDTLEIKKDETAIPFAPRRMPGATLS